MLSQRSIPQSESVSCFRPKNCLRWLPQVATKGASGRKHLFMVTSSQTHGLSMSHVWT